MILVRNRLLQLSGNSLLILILCAGIISCDLLSGAAKQPEGNPEIVYENEIFTNDEIPENDEKESENAVQEDGDEIIRADVSSETFFHGEYYKVAPHKEQFKVALILPFFYRARTNVERSYSNAVLEYYQGLEMALNELKDRGLNLSLYIYDNKNDTNTLKDILRKREIREMDLIIGPIGKEQIEIVSRFSLENGIPVFSPFTGVTESTKNNPLLYSCIPGNKIKARLLVDFLEKNHRDSKLIILRDGNTLDKEFVPYLIEELDRRRSISYMKEAYNRHNRWDILLTKDSANVVYIPSFFQTVVNSSIGGIFSSKREVTVIGENAWADFEDNDYNFWTKLNVHLVAYEYIDQQDSVVQNFRINFRELNFEDPSKYAYMGYDQMNFIGDFLMAFGEHFSLFISEKEFNYLTSSYNFIFDNGFNENSSLLFLKYQDHHLTPVE